MTQDRVVDMVPVGEPREILDDARGVRPEIMGTVLVDEHPGLIVLVLGIASEMPPLFHDGASRASLIGEALGKDKAGKTRANDQKVSFQARGISAF